MDWKTAFELMEKGQLRCANKIDGKWIANPEAKQAILAAFKDGEGFSITKEGRLVAQLVECAGFSR